MLLTELIHRAPGKRLSPGEAVALAHEQGYTAVVAIEHMGDPTHQERLLLTRGIAPRTWTGDHYGDRWEVDPQRGGTTNHPTGHFVTFEPDGLYHAHNPSNLVGTGFPDWQTAINHASGIRLSPETTPQRPSKCLSLHTKGAQWVNFATARQLEWNFTAGYFETEVQRYLNHAPAWSKSQIAAAREGLRTVFANLSGADQEKTRVLWDEIMDNH